MAKDEELESWEASRRRPHPGVRRARICTECGQRKFLEPGEPDWKCPKHPRKTVEQPNVPYFGQSTR